LAGGITLAANSQVNVDSAADTLTLSGNIGGGFALTKGGPGTLLLSGNNSFTEALNVLSGTLSVPSVNNAGSVGPLGQGTAPIVLGGNNAAATLLYTGTGTTSTRAFTLAAGTATISGGIFQVGSNLGLNGVIGGNGGLTMSGSGALTLGASNLYTGVTTINSGTLAIGPTGSINATSGIIVNQGGVLQVTTGTTGNSQLPNAANVTLGGGMLSFAANGSASAGESVGALLLNPGQSQVVVTNSGTGTPYLQFVIGTPHTLGATLGVSTSNAQVQFLDNPPAMTNGILPYAFVGSANSTTVDFATLSTSGETTLVAAYSGYASSVGTNGSLNVAATASQSLTTASSCNALKLVGPASVTMSGAGSLALESGGLICTGSATSITGGTLSAPAGELIIDTATNLSISSVIGAASALTKTGTGTLTLTNTTPIGGNTFINQGTLVYSPTASLNYPQAIEGAGNLLMSGTGTELTLSGNSSFTGSTTVSSGTLCVNGSLAGGGPVTVASGAVLTGSGSIAGSVTISTGTLTLGAQGSGNSLTVGGGVNIGGSGSLIAGGSGAAISGNLNYTSSASSTYSGTVLGSNSVVTLDSPAGATLALSGSNLYGGGTVLEAGMLKPTNAAGLGTGGLTMSGGTLDLDSLPSLAITLQGHTAGVITKSGTGTTALSVFTPGETYLSSINNGNGVVGLTLANSNSGTVVLSGTDTYTGGTSVFGGTLIVQNSTAIASGTSLTVGSSASWEFGGVVPASATSGGPGAPAARQEMAVPEPATLMLLLAAICTVAIYRRILLSRNGLGFLMKGR
jgi:fibronectin-binding autotransporter adhesin